MAKESINFEDGERKFINLEFENGEEREYMVVDIVEGSNGIQYIILIDEQDVGQMDPPMLYYRFSVDEEGDPILDMIETDEELEIAISAFEEVLDDVDYDIMADELDKD